MKNSFCTLVYFFLGIVFFPFSSAWPQASVSVDPANPVYAQLDQLEAFGLMPSKISGQKPYSRSEIARLVLEALRHYPEFEAQYRQNKALSLKHLQQRLSQKIFVDKILAQMQKDYRQEIALLLEKKPQEFEFRASPDESQATIPRFFDFHPLETFRFDYLYLDELPLSLIFDNGLGKLNARFQPLVQNREGRHYQKGSNLAFETLHWARVGDFFSFQVEPRFQIQIARAPFEDETQPFLQRANLHFAYQKIDVEIGRDLLSWGLGSSGGLMFSANARPLDMLKISNANPLQLPGPLEKLGYHQWSLAIANLGPEQHFENSWLWAFKWSYKPIRQLELAWTQTMIAGGQGAPRLGFGQALGEWFSLDGQSGRSNQNFSFELSGEIPHTRGAKIYTELYFEDFSSNAQVMFQDNTSYLFGIYLPRFSHTGRAKARVEYRHLSPRYARDPVFLDGASLNRFLLGDFHGPDSDAVSFELNYVFSPKTVLDFQFQFSRRRDDRYQWVGNEIVKVASPLKPRPEDRYLYSAGLKRQLSKHAEANLRFGIERVHHFDFTQENETFWMGQMGFVYRIP